MDTIQTLLAQRAEIDKKIADTRRDERAGAISTIRGLMSAHELTAADIAERAPSTSAKGRTSSTKGSKVAPKYRNKKTGDTWTGRGLQPRWLRAAIAAGAKISDFQL